MSSVDVRTADTTEDMVHVLALRRTVFIEEQKVDEALELDGLDGQCRHYIAFANGRPVGTARVMFKRPVEIQRVAVAADQRGAGIGHALMRRVIADLRAEGQPEIKISAQCHAESFYRQLGFVSEGDVYDEANIPHIAMRLRF